jgi:hypothetical protein
MDRVGTGDLGGCDQAWDAEVRLARRRRANADVIVGKAHMQRFAIRFRVDGDRLDPDFLAGTNDTERDLAAIRHQDFLEHFCGSLTR